MKKIGIAGAGFAGAVLARELVQSGRFEVEIFESRGHLAGNCHTQRDSKTGIMLHQYGPHIFNTSRKEVWEYVNLYGEFGAFTNRVKAHTKRGVFGLPLNLLTINQFFGKSFNPQQAKDFVASLGDQSIKEPQNFEEQALKFVGRELYENFFYGYTKKQWGVEPTQLPASILKRLPIRFNYDDNYYNQTYQGIPKQGYTGLVEKILDLKGIRVHLNARLEAEVFSDYDFVFYSGPMDAFFKYDYGRLGYRSLVFERFEEAGDFQGNPVINYCDENVSHTRITEHKHFAPWEDHENTVCFREFSKETKEGDTPYYPMRLAADKQKLLKYMQKAQETKRLCFIGRLGTYRYLDMHQVIGESLDLANTCLTTPNLDEWPSFSASPI